VIAIEVELRLKAFTFVGGPLGTAEVREWYHVSPQVSLIGCEP
jgi:hypothetical protein